MSAPAVAIGECMVEFAHEGEGVYRLRYGGDTFNTAVYFSRAGGRIAYLTALGDDPYSDGIAALAEAEGVDASRILRVTGRVPGLYLIETDGRGERTFWYWRDMSPARQLLDLPGGDAVLASVAGARLVYLSGITLSLYGEPARRKLFEALDACRRQGGRVAFDGNFRPRGWPGPMQETRAVFAAALDRTDIALPSFDDERALWGDADPAATIARLRGHGVGEIVAKCGEAGAFLADPVETTLSPPPRRIDPVDTTAAGDSFNGAYLAARERGATPAEACAAGHAMAGHVIAHRGAIVPR